VEALKAFLSKIQEGDVVAVLGATEPARRLSSKQFLDGSNKNRIYQTERGRSK